MEDRETTRMRKYGESKTTRIMMATVPHVTSGLGLRKYQADGFLLTRVYITRTYVPTYLPSQTQTHTHTHTHTYTHTHIRYRMLFIYFTDNVRFLNTSI